MLLSISPLTIAPVSHWMRLGIDPLAFGPIFHWMPLDPLKMVLLLWMSLTRLKMLLLLLTGDPTLVLKFKGKKRLLFRCPLYAIALQCSSQVVHLQLGVCLRGR
jgi:hypothetical protein